MILTNVLEIVKPLLGVGFKALEADKVKAAASISGLPTCFEYGFIGTKAYAKPDIKATREYLKHLREIWGV